MQLETTIPNREQTLPEAMSAPPDSPRRQDAQDAQKQLLARCARGDQEALSALYDRHARILLSLIRRVVGKPEEAEEILQDVFLYAWNRASDYDPKRSSVTTWLVLIARSRAIDRYRQARGFQKMLDHVETESPSHAPPGAAASVLDTQRRQRLQAAMNDLPGEQKYVLEAAYFEGLTQAEIAQNAGIPVGTVKTRTHLAIRKLRSALASEISDLI